MSEPNFLTKLGNWIAATGLSNLDGGDNPHPTPKLPGANTYQIYENLNKEDEQAVKDALSTQHDYDKQMASQKGAVAASALGTGLGVVTAGVIPTIMSAATGYAGSYAGEKIGEKLDDRFDTQWIAPTLSIAGGLYGGYKGYQWAKPAVIPYLMKNPQQNGVLVTKEFATDAVADMANRLVKKIPVNNPGLPANVGWAPAQTNTWYHHSNTPITTFRVPFKKRWDVVNHNADPNLIWLTKENGTAGMMAERPYHQQFEVSLKKPMVQVGEVPTIPGQKNTSRNTIVKTARDMGSDAVIFDGIADNKLRGQKVVAVMGDKASPIHIDNKTPKIETINGYYNKATEEDFKFLDDLFNTSTPENFTFEKDRAAAMFRSDWYKNNLKRKYPDITNYQIEHVVNTLIDDVYNTKGFLVPSTNLDHTPAFHAAYIDRLGNPQNIIVVENYRPDTETKHMAHHELIHASNPHKILPGGINNNDIVMTPKKSIDLNIPEHKELYDYVTSPDELRVRLLRLNQIADVNTLSPQELLKKYRIMMSSEHMENVPIDLRQLLMLFDDDQILNAMKKVVAIGAPVAVGTLIENWQNPYKNERK